MKQAEEFIRVNNLDFFEGNVVKYLSRHHCDKDLTTRFITQQRC